MSPLLAFTQALLVCLAVQMQDVGAYFSYQNEVPNVGVGTSRIPAPVNMVRLGGALVTTPGR